MKFVIVGLGNPGSDYEHTRHNIGWQVVEAFETAHEFGGFQVDKKIKGETAKGAIGKHSAVLVLPHTFMNKSGSAVKPLVTSAKAAERLVVVYDDIDLPLGTLRIAFGRGSGGHKGIESVIRAVSTKNFVRVRVGIAPTTPSGKIKKPQGEQKVVDFVLGTFTKKEEVVLKAVIKSAVEALTSIIEDGRGSAMNNFN